jgi:xylulokinase
MIALGIDSGTQSTKTIALDLESGEILATAQKSYGMIAGLPPGHMEQDPETWFDAADVTVRECAAKLGARREEIRAIGVSGQQHGLVVLDSSGKSIRPAKLWCDTSTTAECAAIHSEFGGREKVIEMVGNAMLPGYTAPKILWLKKNEPSNFERIESVLLPHDYLNFRLTREKRMEYGDASGTALMDVRTRKWSKPLLDFIDRELADKLPRLQSSLQPVGLLRDQLGKDWGLPASVLVSAGGGDNMMGAIGTGNIAPGTFTASLGTSGTLFAFATEPVVDPKGEVAAFCDSTDCWLPLVCTMNVTVATELMRKLLSMDHAAYDAAVQSSSPSAAGLLFLPYLTGERTPDLPDGCGVFHGLTTHNMTAPHMARAIMEGVTMGLGYGVRRFNDLGLKPGEIRLTGGGSNSAVWRQLAADVFDAPVVCLSTSEGAALGAAIQAGATEAQTSGRRDPLKDIVARCVKLDDSSRCQPNSDAAKLYRDLQLKQTSLTAKLHATGYL